MPSLFDTLDDDDTDDDAPQSAVEQHRGLPLMSVTEMTVLLKEVIESTFHRVAVVGEISNLSRAASGHIYLTLKDEHAQVRGVIWRGKARGIRFDMQDGLEVLAVGSVEVYQPRGTYQLIIDELLPRGMGALELAFRQLHDKLEAAGLFAPERKRALPRFPQRIALITSPTGAAVRDLLQVILRRWPQANLVIVPVAVQGAAAAPEIAAALRNVHRIPGVDVVIAGRGGGSLEDLWAFNEEVVARAVHDCRVPVVSAVGHEVDVTIADLVADQRALTPSEAGELVTPAWMELEQTLKLARRRMAAALWNTARRARTQLEQLQERRTFRRPFDVVRQRAEQLDEVQARLPQVMKRRLATERQQLKAVAATMEALSPLKVLARGYSVLHRVEDGGMVRSVNDVSVGDQIRNRVVDGEIVSRVEEPHRPPSVTDAEPNTQ